VDKLNTKTNEFPGVPLEKQEEIRLAIMKCRYKALDEESKQELQDVFDNIQPRTPAVIDMCSRLANQGYQPTEEQFTKLKELCVQELLVKGLSGLLEEDEEADNRPCLCCSKEYIANQRQVSLNKKMMASADFKGSERAFQDMMDKCKGIDSGCPLTIPSVETNMSAYCNALVQITQGFQKAFMMYMYSRGEEWVIQNFTPALFFEKHPPSLE
jgi:hypothetical protein